MTQLVAYKNKIRDYCRKFDEITTPVIRFIFSLIAFFAIRSLFPYHELAARTDVCILLAIMCAILPDGFMVFMMGVLITLHSFTVSFEVGLSFILLFMFMFLVYIKFFPKCGMAIMLSVILLLWGLDFAVPFIVAIFFGLSGAVPAALGVLIYYFGKYADEVSKLLPKSTAADIVSSIASKGNKTQTDGLQFMIEHMMKNKEMFAMMGVFIITVAVIGVIYNQHFKYSQYVALAAGVFANIFSYIYMCFTFELDANLMSCLKGILLGLIVCLVVRFFKGFLDYPHTERVTFEDDEYVYYVKAVPKLWEEKKPAVDFSKLAEKAKKKAGKAPKAVDTAELDESLAKEETEAAPEQAHTKEEPRSPFRRKAPAASAVTKEVPDSAFVESGYDGVVIKEPEAYRPESSSSDWNDVSGNNDGEAMDSSELDQLIRDAVKATEKATGGMSLK